MSTVVYTASVFSRDVSYTNFHGQQKNVTLMFSLSPIALLSLIAGFEMKTIKSGNPARNGQPAPITEEQQLKFIKDIAVASAGHPSDDGESWFKDFEFEDSLGGQAFLTKLTASDEDRREFAEKVILKPFRDFVGFAKAEPNNSPKDIQMLENQLSQIENVFKMPDVNESLEERRARLEAEIAALATNPTE